MAERAQGLLQKWDARTCMGRIHSRLEIAAEGLVLGAGTILVKMAWDTRNRPRLTLDGEQRVLALLATAYEQPVEPYVLDKICRAAELWNEGEKVLAHIHLAYADLPPCDEDRVFRLFLAEECLAVGVAPVTLMKAQGFDPDLSKYSYDQPRVAAGNGSESGRWTSGGAGDSRITVAAGGKGAIRLVQQLFEAARRAARTLRARQTKPAKLEVPHPESRPLELEGGELSSKFDSNKLHHIFDKQGRELDEFLSNYESQEAAFQAIEAATRNAIKEQRITGQYKIPIEIGGYKLGVGGKVMDDGTIKIGTAYPWKN